LSCGIILKTLKNMESIINKKAHFDYQINDTLIAGIELSGHETKAIRFGKAQLTGSFVKIYGRQMWLVGATIGPYQEKNAPKDFDPSRSRRLLVNKAEIEALMGTVSAKKAILIPLKLFEKKGKIKLEIGMGISKKKSDKREVIKKRETKREIDRKIKG